MKMEKINAPIQDIIGKRISKLKKNHFSDLN
jgi:hypothetical protein